MDNVGMLDSTQYRTFFPEATNRVFLLRVERLVEVLSCACEALVFDGTRCRRQRRSLVPVPLQSLVLLGVCTAAELLPDSLLFFLAT